MRTIVIEHAKLKQLLEKKTEAVIQGREMSEEIETLEADMKKIDEEIQVAEKAIDLKEFEDEAAKTTDELKVLMAKMEEIQKQIYAKLKKEVDPAFALKYEEKKKVKEAWETERNKLGLKIQKFKDLIIPLTQKVAKPLLTDEFEDFSDIRLENGEVVIDIFSHLDDWKEARRKKLASK